MATNSVLDSPIWKQFQAEAHKRRQNPEDLLTSWMRECLEIWQDEAVDDEISEAVRASGFQEEDAVELVQGLRREKKMNGAL